MKFENKYLSKCALMSLTLLFSLQSLADLDKWSVNATDKYVINESLDACNLKISKNNTRKNETLELNISLPKLSAQQELVGVPMVSLAISGQTQAYAAKSTNEDDNYAMAWFMVKEDQKQTFYLLPEYLVKNRGVSPFIQMLKDSNLMKFTRTLTGKNNKPENLEVQITAGGFTKAFKTLEEQCGGFLSEGSEQLLAQLSESMRLVGAAQNAENTIDAISARGKLALQTIKEQVEQNKKYNSAEQQIEVAKSVTEYVNLNSRYSQAQSQNNDAKTTLQNIASDENFLNNYTQIKQQAQSELQSAKVTEQDAAAKQQNLKERFSSAQQQVNGVESRLDTAAQNKSAAEQNLRAQQRNQQAKANVVQSVESTLSVESGKKAQAIAQRDTLRFEIDNAQNLVRQAEQDMNSNRDFKKEALVKVELKYESDIREVEVALNQHPDLYDEDGTRVLKVKSFARKYPEIQNQIQRRIERLDLMEDPIESIRKDIEAYSHHAKEAQRIQVRLQKINITDPQAQLAQLKEEVQERERHIQNLQNAYNQEAGRKCGGFFGGGKFCKQMKQQTLTMYQNSMNAERAKITDIQTTRIAVMEATNPVSADPKRAQEIQENQRALADNQQKSNAALRSAQDGKSRLQRHDDDGGRRPGNGNGPGRPGGRGQNRFAEGDDHFDNMVQLAERFQRCQISERSLCLDESKQYEEAIERRMQHMRTKKDMFDRAYSKAAPLERNMDSDIINFAEQLRREAANRLAQAQQNLTTAQQNFNSNEQAIQRLSQSVASIEVQLDSARRDEDRAEQQTSQAQNVFSEKSRELDRVERELMALKSSLGYDMLRDALAQAERSLSSARSAVQSATANLSQIESRKARVDSEAAGWPTRKAQMNQTIASTDKSMSEITVALKPFEDAIRNAEQAFADQSKKLNEALEAYANIVVEAKARARLR